MFDVVLTLLPFLTAAASAGAAVRYVDVNGANATPPYTNWATAATNIQDAVDAAAAGDEIVVTNGTYAAGGRPSDAYAMATNRVVVDKPLALRSVNGPQFTFVQGDHLPGWGNYGWGGWIRCVCLASGASLSGFTLTNGAADSGGGVWCESTDSVVSNCIVTGNAAQNGGGAYMGTLNDCTLSENTAGDFGGGATGSTLNDCTLSGNSAYWGGGAGACWLNNCTLTGNRAFQGGGACSATLNKCTLSENVAGRFGGGAAGCTLNNCTLTGNSADAPGGGGGGAVSCTLNNCALSGNSAHGGDSSTYAIGGGASTSTLLNCTLTGNSSDGGGAAAGCTLNNCTVTGNYADAGGGAYSCTLNNCTVIGNSAGNHWYTGAGGVDACRLNNCILYDNDCTGPPTSGSDYSRATLIYCCTTLMPTNGVGNITHEPLFVDRDGGNLRLQANSPCINAGSNAYAPGATDLDGCPRVVGGTVDIGAYEFQAPGSVISYAWLQQYGLPTDGSADATDPDADGLNNWQEWRCATVPTNALSVLRLLSASPAGANVAVRWQSVAGVSYFLERSTNLAATPRFTPLATNLSGQAGTTTYADTNPAPLAPLFYRVGVGE